MEGGCPSHDEAIHLEGWDRLLTYSLLSGRDMENFTSYPVYSLEDKMTEHTILSCPRARLI